MDAMPIAALLESAATEDSRELDRTCERAAARLVEEGVEPSFDVTSADFDSDPYLICADRYWRLRFLEEPTVSTAAECAVWLHGRVAAEHRTEVGQKWSLGYAFITRDTVESRRELAEATEQIVEHDNASGDAAFFATLYHAGKLRSNFSFDELHQFLESSLLAVAAGEDHRQDPLFVALQAFAGFGSKVITTEHATNLLDRAWASPDRTRHVVDVCLNGLWVAASFDAPGALLRDRAIEAVAEYPNDHLFHFRLARGHNVCGDHEAAWDAIEDALRLLPARGTRGSHKLLQEQYVRERDIIHADRRLARSLDEADRRLADSVSEVDRRLARFLDDQEQRWGRQEDANREVRQTLQAATIRGVELLAIFTAVIAFFVGSLQVTLQGDLPLADRVWLVVLQGVGLAVFALVIIGVTWYITRSRGQGGRGNDRGSSG